ncbi:hypothetical protein D9Q98_002546 [Chlorella vulgaris]|uniref:non-specific serine/threonine protein kinase n=1 Tax=Chlorella vulgaris TaxID=3077 RepID=A0A9D4YZD5_CHLVU|nr:hypothetical protein D9Q98_002546 [Chlorella vulgaris]
MKRLLFLCCLCLLAIRPVTSVKQTERVGKQQRPIAVRVSPEHTLLVSLANGKIVALDKNTGAKLWTFDSGAPLLTSTNPAQLGTASDVGGTGVRSVGSIFPGTDGSLYSYLAADDEIPRIERLPVLVSELVNRSPVSTLDGNMLLGSQHTSVFFLDGKTGQLIKTVYDFDGQLGQLDASVLGDEAGVNIELSSVVIIGRRDYVLRAVHPQFGLQWNVTWGQVDRMPELEVQQFGNLNRDVTQEASGALPQAPGSEAPPADVRLLVGQDFSLRCVHPGDGWEQWLHYFDAPPLAAYLATSRVNLLGVQLAEAPTPSSAVAPAYALPPALGSRSSVPDNDAMVLVTQNGSLFGIPAAHLTFDAAGSGGPAAAAAAAGQCEMPEAERVVRAQQLGDGSERGAVQVFRQEQLQDDEGWLGSTQCKPAADYCAAPTLVLHAVQKHGAHSIMQLPAMADNTPAAVAPQQQQATIRLADWLLLLGGTALGGTVVAVVVSWTLRNRSAAVQQPALEPIANLQPSGVDAAAAPSSSKGRPKARNKRGGQQMSNRVKGIMLAAAAQEGSDEAMPPPAAAPVVPSAAPEWEQLDDDSLPNSMAVAAGLTNLAIRAREVKDGVILIGRLRVGPGVLGYGSGGTVVFSGELDGRPVAVKRMLRQFYEMARKEINALILADEHPNIVRCFAMEEDHEFIYLALEKCKATLTNAMQNEASQHRFVGPGGPTPLAYQIAAEIGHGVAALHERGIVHRDLKPHNVLLTESGKVKLSDMGLSKQLVPEQISFESVGSGGSSGWQAPEQLISRSGGMARQTNSVDVFSFGLLLHYCLTGGQHPFGELYERDANILQCRLNLKHVQHLPEAVNLIRGCCGPQDPDCRPSMASVLVHPMWWPAPQRLAFLIAVSDRVEGEDRTEDQTMYQALECCTQDAIGHGGSWAALMDSGLVNNLGKYRKYSYTSLRDLLRVIRNKHNHFRELPIELQKKVGPLPSGFLAYFTSRCPGLLLTCYYFALKWCSHEPVLQPYFPPQAAQLLEHMAPRSVLEPPAPSPEPLGSTGAAMQLSAADAALLAARQASLLASAAAAAFASQPALDVAGVLDDDEQQPLSLPQQPSEMGPGSQDTVGNGSRPSSGNRHAGHTPLQLGTPNPGRLLKGVRLPPALLLEPSLPEHDIAPVSIVEDELGRMALFPQRPGQPICDFYQKTGHCRFGEACRFDHPPEYAVRLNHKGLPLRPGQPVCAFYQRTSECRYAAACKYHHPD